MSVILTDAEYASGSAQKAKSTSIITYIQASYILELHAWQTIPNL